MVVDALLDAGCDVDADGGLYRNALQAASFGGHEEIVRLLIEKGANGTAREAITVVLCKRHRIRVT